MFTNKLHILSLALSLLPVLFFTACHNDAKSNVPDYPVRIDIDIQNEYPHFVPAAPCQSLVFDKKRYEYEAIGYSGVVVWININGEYRAADLCCPKCLQRNKPVEVDGMLAVCPTCGERFDLTTYAFPTKGIATQPLKAYGVSYTGIKLHVRN